MKNTVAQIKISLEEISSKVDSVGKKKKRKVNLKVRQPKPARRRSNSKLQMRANLQHSTESSDMRAIGVSEGEGRETAKIFEGMMPENFKLNETQHQTKQTLQQRILTKTERDIL